MDNEMIERVARVICKSGRFETGQGACALLCMDQLGDARRNCPHSGRLHGELAKAAIKAMREPTEKMINATDCIDPAEAQWSKEIWQDMIDAVIND